MAVGKNDLANRFGYHPATEETAPVHEKIRALHLTLAVAIDELVPDGRDKSLALTHLEESMHWSNAAVAKQAPLGGSTPGV